MKWNIDALKNKKALKVIGKLIVSWGVIRLKAKI
jgi:hypothetical protein